MGVGGGWNSAPGELSGSGLPRDYVLAKCGKQGVPQGSQGTSVGLRATVRHGFVGRVDGAAGSCVGLCLGFPSG